MTREEMIENGIWEMKGGKQIYISDMTSNHIKNTIALLQRTNTDGFNDALILRFQDELDYRVERWFKDEEGYDE